MTQLRSFAMTDTADTFRQGATAFRNARDWKMERRDEAIKYANNKANDLPSTTPTGSALESSFTTEVSTLVATTSLSIATESQSQESPATQIEASYTSETAHQESETSTDELVTDVHPPAKRSLRSRRSRYRKRNTGESSTRRSSIAAGAQRSEQLS